MRRKKLPYPAESLSEEDKNWAKKVSVSNSESKLTEAVSEGKKPRVAYILETYKLAGPQRFSLCKNMATVGDAEMLDILLTTNSARFSFSDNTEENKKMALELFKAAANKSEDIKKILLNVHAKEYTVRLDEMQILKAWEGAIDRSEIISLCMQAKNAAISTFLEDPSLLSPEEMKIVLEKGQHYSEADHYIKYAFVDVVASGDLGKAALLMEYGASPNHQCEGTLLAAAQNCQAEMVEFLIPHTDLNRHSGEILDFIKNNEVDAGIAETLKTATEQAVAKAEDEKRFKKVDESTVSESQELPSGGTLTMVFNFKTRQQTQIFEKPGQSSIAVTSFDDIGDQGVIDLMHEKLHALGGTAENTKSAKMQKAPALGGS